MNEDHELDDRDPDDQVIDDRAVFEAIQFVEPELRPGVRYTGPQETLLGRYAVEADAIAVGRTAWEAHRAATPGVVAWWIVRKPGESLARWIADSRNPAERVLDLTTNQLVEYRR